MAISTNGGSNPTSVIYNGINVNEVYFKSSPNSASIKVWPDTPLITTVETKLQSYSLGSDDWFEFNLGNPPVDNEVYSNFIKWNLYRNELNTESVQKWVVNWFSTIYYQEPEYPLLRIIYHSTRDARTQPEEGYYDDRGPIIKIKSNTGTLYNNGNPVAQFSVNSYNWRAVTPNYTPSIDRGLTEFSYQARCSYSGHAVWTKWLYKAPRYYELYVQDPLYPSEEEGYDWLTPSYLDKITFNIIEDENEPWTFNIEWNIYCNKED